MFIKKGSRAVSPLVSLDAYHSICGRENHFQGKAGKDYCAR